MLLNKRTWPSSSKQLLAGVHASSHALTLTLCVRYRGAAQQQSVSQQQQQSPFGAFGAPTAAAPAHAPTPVSNKPKTELDLKAGRAVCVCVRVLMRGDVDVCVEAAGEEKVEQLRAADEHSAAVGERARCDG
jgi:hypothetical protein